MRRLRWAVWRARWLFAVAGLVVLAQQLGWSRVGHALALVPIGKAMWLAVKAGWPILMALIVVVAFQTYEHKRLFGDAAGVRPGMAVGHWLGVAAMVVGVAGLLVVVLVAAPPRFVRDQSLEGLKAQNEVRTTLLQGLGGVVLLVGVYVTYRQLRTSREGQITERYTRAVDQLGHAQVDVRLGGIYALERIARDSPADRATIGEVLTAFIRGHAPWPPRLPGQYVATAPLSDVPQLQVRAPDVQASLTVLGRGGFARRKSRDGRLDLGAVDLRRADLSGAHLEVVNLTGAHLEGADLSGARLALAGLGGVHLELANLDVAHLEGAYLDGAHLAGANLGGARLEDADLEDANLEGANLHLAHLEGARLVGAHLEGANLRGAHLEEAILLDVDLEGILRIAHLQGALADNRTGWPDEFDWCAAGIIVEGEDTAAGSP